MQVKEIKLKELKPAEYNPRAMTEKEAKDLRNSLDKFGMVEPIIVNMAKGRENVIIGGHQRYFLLKEMGKETIPVVYVNLPNLKDEQELNLRLNKNNGHWDFDMLANTFDVDKLLELGFGEYELGLKNTFDFNEAWKGMPEFIQKDKSAYKSLLVNFDNEKGLNTFLKLINQTITDKTKSIWFPKHEIRKKDKVYKNES